MQVTMDRASEIQDKRDIIIAPASITCFFTPFKSKNALESGSFGVGIALKNGSTALCRNSPNISISFEGCNRVITVFKALEIIKERKIEVKNCKVLLKPNYPVGSGFGMSASLTLSTLKALRVPSKIIPDLAHEAEVLSSTGLGDVVTQTYGGIVCRLNASCPSKAIVKKFNFLKTLDIISFGELDTKEMLEEYNFSTGLKHLKEFLKKPTLEELFKHSKQFTLESGVADDKIIDVIEAVESKGGMASMVMLGKAVFAVNGFEAMKEFGEPKKVEVDFNGFIVPFYNTIKNTNSIF